MALRRLLTAGALVSATMLAVAVADTGRAAPRGTTPGPSYAEGPPPAHTGGFGEPTCFACHWDGELNEEGGTIELLDLPQRFVAGRRYELGLRLTHPELAAAGFELSARFVDAPREGLGAGTLVPGSGQGLVTDGTPAVTYLRQNGEGGGTEWEGSADWRFEWVAPEGDAGPVVFHVSANAANGDVSEFGDRIYTLERTVASESGSP